MGGTRSQRGYERSQKVLVFRTVCGGVLPSILCGWDKGTRGARVRGPEALVSKPFKPCCLILLCVGGTKEPEGTRGSRGRWFSRLPQGGFPVILGVGGT